MLPVRTSYSRRLKLMLVASSRNRDPSFLLWVTGVSKFTGNGETGLADSAGNGKRRPGARGGGPGTRSSASAAPARGLLPVALTVPGPH